MNRPNAGVSTGFGRTCALDRHMSTAKPSNTARDAHFGRRRSHTMAIAEHGRTLGFKEESLEAQSAVRTVS
ncbi:hypothetical protein Vi05172_g13544 [Venturia inaequalis]|nr:hypothetical protein Vi05172_g13544 [Venturia inaequalis]